LSILNCSGTDVVIFWIYFRQKIDEKMPNLFFVKINSYTNCTVEKNLGYFRNLKKTDLCK
jgi:hypothetical protein